MVIRDVTSYVYVVCRLRQKSVVLGAIHTEQEHSLLPLITHDSHRIVVSAKGMLIDAQEEEKAASSEFLFRDPLGFFSGHRGHIV
jgi:hypothetical protein